MKRPGKHNVFVIGFMASGKTKLGRLLAERLGWRFIDTDAEIEKGERRPVSQIFAQNGESYFRHLEARAIARFAKGKKQIVAVGGGAVMNSKNISAMRKHGIILYRETSFDVLFERAERKGDAKRPLWSGASVSERRKSMSELYALRRPYYRKAAHLTLRTTAGTAQEASDRALRRLLSAGWINP